MQDRSLGDEFGNLFRRIQLLEEEVIQVRSRLTSALAGNRVVASSIVGVLPPSGGGTGYTTGSGPTIQPFVNNSGGALSDGDVVIIDTSGARRVTTSTTPGDILAVGVVRDVSATGPFANGAETPVMLLGNNATVNVTGAVAAGDYLQISASAGEAESAGATPSDGSFAIAETAAAGPGSGTVTAFVYGIDNLGSSPTPGSGSGSVGPRGLRGERGPRGIGIPGGSTPYTIAYFEAVLAADGGWTAYARLYNATASLAITGSEVNTAGATPTRVRSAAIVLPVTSATLEAQFGGTTPGGKIKCYSADLIIDTYIGARRISRQYLNFGVNPGGQVSNEAGGTVVPSPASSLINYDVTTVDVVNTAAETDLYNFTIPAGSLAGGDMLRLTLLCDLLNNSGSNKTYQVRVYVGGTLYYDSTTGGFTMTARTVSNLIFMLGVNALTTQETLGGDQQQGSFAALPATGEGQIGASAGHAAILGFPLIDASVAIALRVTLTWSAANAATSWRRFYAGLELLKAP